MSRLRRRRKRKPLSEMNVVPYIDVMLVLLIIFMVTAPLITQGVKVNLPQAAAKKLPPQTTIPIIVSVNSKGLYFLNINRNPKAPLAANSLSLQVRTALMKNKSRKVYVRGDNKVDYGKVIKAMVLLQHAGAKTVGLMTDDKKA